MLTKKPLSRAIYIVAAKRTPFGTFGGALKDLSATDLAVVAAKAALSAGNVSPELIEAVCFGNVSQTSADALYLARHVGLRSNVPVPVPALTVNRLCGSGFQAIVNGAQDILLGDLQAGRQQLEEVFLKLTAEPDAAAESRRGGRGGARARRRGHSADAP